MKIRITAALAGPLLAAGIAVGGVALGTPANAAAQPGSAASCTTMPMTSGRGGPVPSVMTRAGQIARATYPPASAGGMAVGCAPGAHG